MSTLMHADGWDVVHAQFYDTEPQDTFRALVAGLRGAGASITVVDAEALVVLFEDAEGENFCRRAQVVPGNGGSFIVSGIPADLPLPRGGMRAQLGLVRPRSGEDH